MAGNRKTLVCLVSFSLGVTSAMGGAETLAIRSGTILTINRGVVEHGTILIEGGKIKGLGQEVVVPQEARVIEAAGKYVIPGMIDAASQLFVREGERQNDDAISPERTILDALDPFIKEREEVLAQGVTAVYVAPGHGVLGGCGAVLRLNGAHTTQEMVLKANVAVKGAIGLSPDGYSSSLSRLADFASLREALIETQTYLRERCRYEQDLAEYEKKKAEKKEEQKKDEDPQKAKKDQPARPAKYKTNPTYETLAKVLSGEIPLQIEAHRADDILNALRLAEEFHLRLILDRCTEGYRVADEIARRGVPVIAGSLSRSFIGPPALEYRDHDARNAALLSTQGVKVALGVGGRDGASSKYAALVAALAVAGGMDEGLALRAVTLTPAEVLGVAGRIGSLDVGKDADIVILSGPPLATLGRVEMVLIEGKVVYERKGPAGDEREGQPHGGGPSDQRAAQIADSGRGANPQSAIVNPQSARIVIRAGKIWTAAGAAVADGVVVVEGDKICAVGTGIFAPAGAKVLDLEGKHVIPGLVDAHCHLGLSLDVLGEIEETVAAVTPEMCVLDAFNPLARDVTRALQAGVTTVGLAPGYSAPIAGQMAVVKLGGRRDKASVLNPSVGVKFSLGKEVLMPDRRPTSRAGLMALLREELDKAKTSDPKSLDARTEILSRVVKGQLPVHLYCSSVDEILSALQLIDVYKLNATLVGAREADELAQVLAERNIAVAYTPTLFLSKDRDLKRVAALAGAGVKVAFTSMSPQTDTSDLRTSAVLAMKYGLAREAALRAVTIHAAQMLGVAQRVGSIEPGKDADLVVLSGDPLELTSRVEMVLVNGNIVYQREQK